MRGLTSTMTKTTLPWLSIWTTLPRHLRNCRTTSTQECLLRWPHQCHQTASQGREKTWRIDRVHRRDVLVPVGEQKWDIPNRTPPSHCQPRRSRYPSLLRDSQGRHSTPIQSVSSRPAAPTPKQTRVPSLSNLHGRRDGKTPARKIVPLPSHPRATHATRRMMHPRNPESRRTRVHSTQDPRSPPLPTQST